MNISKEGIAITGRFFEAIDMLKSTKQIRGLQTFTKQYNINRRNLKLVQSDPECRVLKPELLSYIVRDYGISAIWLLTGHGKIFTNTTIHNTCHTKTPSEQ